MVDKVIEEEAKRVYAEAKANGTLKPPKALGAVTTYTDGKTRTASASETTWRDYVNDARRDRAT